MLYVRQNCWLRVMKELLWVFFSFLPAFSAGRQTLCSFSLFFFFLLIFDFFPIGVWQINIFSHSLVIPCVHLFEKDSRINHRDFLLKLPNLTLNSQFRREKKSKHRNSQSRLPITKYTHSFTSTAKMQLSYNRHSTFTRLVVYRSLASNTISLIARSVANYHTLLQNFCYHQSRRQRRRHKRNSEEDKTTSTGYDFPVRNGAKSIACARERETCFYTSMRRNAYTN